MQPRPAFSQDTLASSRKTRRGQLPDQRWRIAKPQPDRVADIAQGLDLPPLLAQVLVNRGIDSVAAAQHFVNPEVLQLPSPLEEFPDLAAALELLLEAIAHHHKIAICGDYDADGMTSTALLLRSLRYLGAQVDYAIPSRMSEGYGINRRIVEDFHADGVRIILTVDNGIAAYDPIAYARELGLVVIITDHHDLPPQLPPANAILNPKLLDIASPYSGVAGVGVAYILAVCLAQALQQTKDLTTPLLELFTLGTIADLAPLTGVNRRWVRRGLKLLPRSRILGIQALIQVAGLANEDKALKPEAIGFRLGPRINAVGRIADPQVVIELLTTDDPGRALELAMVCEQINQHRQRLCELIEQEAIAWCEATQPNLMNDRVLVVVQPGWHHGVIGIVASRLVERYGVPVFIGTYEQEDQQHIRGSARGIPEFNVFKALQFTETVLEKYGGHRAAGGFSLKAEHLDEFRFRLSLSANQQLMPQHLKPLVTVDAQADFQDLSLHLCEQIDRLHPCGMENPDPVFWSGPVRVLEQRVIGKNQDHLKLTLGQISDSAEDVTFKAIAWRWGEYCPLPSPIDIAYRLKINEWNNSRTLELELIGVRPNAATPLPDPVAEPPIDHPIDASFQHLPPQRVEFTHGDRPYACSISITPTSRELRIQNAQGQVLALQPEQRRGLLGRSRDEAIEIDVAQPFYFHLIRAALQALQSSTPVQEDTQDILEEAIAPVDHLEHTDGFAAPEPDSEMAELEEAIALTSRVDWVDDGDASAPEMNDPDRSEKLTTVLNHDPEADWDGADGDDADDVNDPDETALTQATVLNHELEADWDEVDGDGVDEVDEAALTQATVLNHELEADWDEADMDDFDEAALAQEMEALANEGAAALAGPVVADLYLSAQMEASDDEPPQDLASIPGLMTAAQLQARRAKQPVQPYEKKMAEPVQPTVVELVQPTAVGSSRPPAELDSTPESAHPLPDPMLTPAEDAADIEPSAAVLPLVTDLHLDLSPASSPLEELRTAPSLFSAPQMRKWFMALVGKSRWECLQARSQTDLAAAYRGYQAQWQDGGEAADYSEAGDRFSLAVDREVIQPFFKDLRAAFVEQNQPPEVAGLRLLARKKYTATDLLPLLADHWQIAEDTDLDDPNPGSHRLKTVQAPLIAESDRTVIQTFLRTWQHPLAKAMQQQETVDAIAHLAQLCDRAQQDGVPFYAWQFDQLHQYLWGSDRQPGLF
ncbi:single-stranded-DNA-specific exonuclease RecJ [Leptolyngbya sp. CCY15150]|uniref:single-stranded-DNA-specific exonuclease RecJ n=1 Tax=Leptolyngbya sp. CCY15150 TaxID=2767772 RepID=UPI001951D0CC|nr:single-stranded-DNA-specific exonuclease RecJ [Leptolyngbya sp. CCY15150]